MMWPALAYLLGVWWLQKCANLANLTDLAWMWSLLLLASPKLWAKLWATRYRQLSRLWLILCAFLLGFSYANGRAYHRMQDRLAADLQGKTLQVIGVVSSIPQYQPNALRFTLDVEQVLGLPDPSKFPQHLSLSQYLQSQFAPQQVIKPLPIQAGQRWLLTVKLKRPHGLSNPASRDSEAWAITHDIGATGSLLNGGHQLQQSLVHSPSYLLLRLREHISQRIQQVLKGKATVPVLQALAVGNDGGIDSDDWQTFRQTGVNHLISISGLHITMLAGLLAYLVWQAWRRSARLCLRLPARVAAAIAGFVVAWGYALLAGFSVPTQRELS